MAADLAADVSRRRFSMIFDRFSMGFGRKRARFGIQQWIAPLGGAPFLWPLRLDDLDLGSHCSEHLKQLGGRCGSSKRLVRSHFVRTDTALGLRDLQVEEARQAGHQGASWCWRGLCIWRQQAERHHPRYRWDADRLHALAMCFRGKLCPRGPIV